MKLKLKFQVIGLLLSCGKPAGIIRVRYVCTSSNALPSLSQTSDAISSWTSVDLSWPGRGSSSSTVPTVRRQFRTQSPITTSAPPATSSTPNGTAVKKLILTFIFLTLSEINVAVQTADQRVYRLAMATSLRMFSNDGIFSPTCRGWGVQALPFSLCLIVYPLQRSCVAPSAPSPTKLARESYLHFFGSDFEFCTFSFLVLLKY